MKQTYKAQIMDGNTVLGIEFGSTRIKAVLVNHDNDILATGSFAWENNYQDGFWTYSHESIIEGLQACYRDVKNRVIEEYGIPLQTIGGLGISGMMHGYIALDTNNQLLVPFRTWRNTTTEESATRLSKEFDFHIPQRWTIAHLYQAILNKEEHIESLAHVTTLAGYIHFLLTGQKNVGIGEASGIFPIDSTVKTYNQSMIGQFEVLIQGRLSKPIQELFPNVLTAGSQAGTLTESGAMILDPSGDLKQGIPFAPPEGDAGTGMVATNAIQVRTGNVSAGTSVFAMIVLEKPLSKAYDMIDIVTTPVGDTVAMVHVNNCTSDINAWVEFMNDVLQTFGVKTTTDTLYETLFNKALEGSIDDGKLLSYNYFSGEHITGLDQGRPLFIRKNDSAFNVANVMKVHLFSALATLRIGMDILLQKEHIAIDSLTGHGGLFKTPHVGQKILASALHTPITILATAGEGGPYGMALLINYMIQKRNYDNLSKYLIDKAFTTIKKETIEPETTLHKEFNDYLHTYKKGLKIEQLAVQLFE